MSDEIHSAFKTLLASSGTFQDAVGVPVDSLDPVAAALVYIHQWGLLSAPSAPVAFCHVINPDRRLIGSNTYQLTGEVEFRIELDNADLLPDAIAPTEAQKNAEFIDIMETIEAEILALGNGGGYMTFSSLTRVSQELSARNDSRQVWMATFRGRFPDA